MRLDAADFADAERRKSILKDMLGGMGEHVHIDIDFRCEYGKNGVTSAGSVVTRSVPADCVAVGNPCRVLREISDHDREFYFKDRRIDWSEV